MISLPGEIRWLVLSLRDSFYVPTCPGASVRGFHMPPLRGWDPGPLIPLSNSQLTEWKVLRPGSGSMGENLSDV